MFSVVSCQLITTCEPPLTSLPIALVWFLTRRYLLFLKLHINGRFQGKLPLQLASVQVQWSSSPVGQCCKPPLEPAGSSRGEHDGNFASGPAGTVPLEPACKFPLEPGCNSAWEPGGKIPWGPAGSSV